MSITVEAAAPAACRRPEAVVLPAETGYLASHVVTQTGLGTSDCPWTINARSGQHIVITVSCLPLFTSQMLDNLHTCALSIEVLCCEGKYLYVQVMEFGLMTKTGDDEWTRLNYFTRDCPINLMLKQNDKEQAFPLCSEGRRERELFSSDSHVITMHLNIHMNQGQLPHFLLKYHGKLFMSLVYVYKLV